MKPEHWERFNYKGNIINSDDIISARNKVQESMLELGTRKTTATLLKTASSDIYRLFLEAADQVETEIRSLDGSDTHCIVIRIYGKLKDSTSGNNHSVAAHAKEYFDEKLQPHSDIFTNMELNFDDSCRFDLTLSYREKR